MSKIVKVKNKGNPVYIGKRLCGRGLITEVIKSELIAFCKTPSGAALFNTTMYVVDNDIKKQLATEREAMKSQAMAEVRQELGPVIKKEIEAEIRKEMEGSFKALELKVSDLVNEKQALEDQIKILKKGPSESDTTDKDDTEKPFVFDPEKHTLEHRGGGKYYVMNIDDTKALDRAITTEEKTEFEALQKKED